MTPWEIQGQAEPLPHSEASRAFVGEAALAYLPFGVLKVLLTGEQKLNLAAHARFEVACAVAGDGQVRPLGVF
jgi:hypothetical protein